MSCHKLLQAAMRDRGFRMTRQRRLVLDAMHKFHHPVTADEVLRSVRHSDSGTDLATVYRTLNFLEGFGLISAYDAGNGSRRYEHNGGDGTPHLICRECGQTSRISRADFKKTIDSIAKSSGYSVQYASVVVQGLCPGCAKKQGKVQKS
jgi:Fur family transcriptional regulator, ferric uptake regulator